MTIPDSEVCFCGHENGFMLKIFAIRGRDFLIYRYKFMNVLKDIEICDKMQAGTKTGMKTAYDDVHFKVVR